MDGGFLYRTVLLYPMLKNGCRLGLSFGVASLVSLVYLGLLLAIFGVQVGRQRDHKEMIEEYFITCFFM